MLLASFSSKNMSLTVCLVRSIHRHLVSCHFSMLLHQSGTSKTSYYFLSTHPENSEMFNYIICSFFPWWWACSISRCFAGHQIQGFALAYTSTVFVSSFSTVISTLVAQIGHCCLDMIALSTVTSELSTEHLGSLRYPPKDALWGARIRDKEPSSETPAKDLWLPLVTDSNDSIKARQRGGSQSNHVNLSVHHNPRVFFPLVGEGLCR